MLFAVLARTCGVRYLWWFHYHGPVVTVGSELNPKFLPIGVCGVIVNVMGSDQVPVDES